MTDTAMETQKREGAINQPERTRAGRVYSPNVDIVEKENELLVLADVPGVQHGDVDINYEQGLLTIHACVRPRQETQATGCLRCEYGVGDFYRSFQIGEGIDASKIEAELRDGVLMLHLPKAETAKPRRIEVKAS
jgi:HSP20 family molecular chaperone IbpA